MPDKKWHASQIKYGLQAKQSNVFGIPLLGVLLGIHTIKSHDLTIQHSGERVNSPSDKLGLRVNDPELLLRIVKFGHQGV